MKALRPGQRASDAGQSFAIVSRSNGSRAIMVHYFRESSEMLRDSRSGGGFDANPLYTVSAPFLRLLSFEDREGVSNRRGCLPAYHFWNPVPCANRAFCSDAGDFHCICTMLQCFCHCIMWSLRIACFQFRSFSGFL